MKPKAMKLTVEEYIRINKAFNRKDELERNGGRWVSKDRPHKNRKKYDRKKFKHQLSQSLKEL